jgi:hypothetical protein
MERDTAEQVGRVVQALIPALDARGFHITRIPSAPHAGRLNISYEASAGIPSVLLDAIAEVTQVDVDFVKGGAVSIAAFTSDRHRSSVSIEDLLAERDL